MAYSSRRDDHGGDGLDSEDWKFDRRIYVGGITDDVHKDEVEEACRKFGDVVDIWIARNPSGFAFVEYKHRKDAARAVEDLHKS